MAVQEVVVPVQEEEVVFLQSHESVSISCPMRSSLLPTMWEGRGRLRKAQRPRSDTQAEGDAAIRMW